MAGFDMSDRPTKAEQAAMDQGAEFVLERMRKLIDERGLVPDPTHWWAGVFSAMAGQAIGECGTAVCRVMFSQVRGIATEIAGERTQ